MFLLSCGGNSVEATSKEESKTETQVDAFEGVDEDLDGEELMAMRCYSCHNTQGTDNMLAPPMHRVKAHYVDDETTRDEFIQAVVNWVDDPTEEKSLMPGARSKFGLMPKQAFDEKEVKAIAAYMYDNEL